MEDGGTVSEPQRMEHRGGRCSGGGIERVSDAVVLHGLFVCLVR